MDDKPNSRMSILSKVATSDGKFDSNKCQQILGDHYDSFINFCNHLKVLPDVESVGMCEFTHNSAKFTVRTKDGKVIEIES
jgi:hypothetical protein